MRSFKKDIVKSGSSSSSTGKNIVQTVFKNKSRFNDTNNILKIDGFEAKITLKKPSHVRVSVSIGEVGHDGSGGRYESSFYIFRDNKRIGCDDSSNEAMFKTHSYDNRYNPSTTFIYIDENVPAGTHTYDVRISPHSNIWINRGGAGYNSNRYDRGTISTMILEEITIGGNQ